MAFAHLQCLQLDGQLGNVPATVGLATLDERTAVALGRLGSTLDGSEVHDGLIVEGGSRAVAADGGLQLVLGQSSKELLAFGGVDGRVDAEIAGQYAIDVAVDDGSWQVKGY